MSIRNLEEEIKKRIKEATKGIKLIDTEGEYVDPLIEIGALPKKAAKGNPYILIQTTYVGDEANESDVEVAVLYGTVGMSEADHRNEEKMKQTYAYGHWDVISIIDKIRENFLKDTNFNFGHLKRKMKHEVFGEVKFPYYLGESKLNFTVATVAPQDDYL